MIKSISNFGTLITKEVQQSIKGGGPYAPNWCKNKDHWGPIKFCHSGQETFYDYNLGYCSCRTKTLDF